MTGDSTANRAAAPAAGRGPWTGRIALAAIVAAAFALCAFGLVALLWPTSPRRHQIRLVTDIDPHRQALGEQIRAEGRRHYLDIELSTKDYSALSTLDFTDSANEAKYALAPGGITTRDYRRVRVVTALNYEPLHVLVRPQLAEGGLAGLRGKRVNIGLPTSASYHLSREVLAFVGLLPLPERPAGGYVLDATSPASLQQELGRIETLAGPERAESIARLPDAFLFLAPLPSEFAKRLVVECGYRLLPVPFAEAYCAERLNRPDSTGIRIDRSVLGKALIPPYTYGGDPPVPPRPCPTISAPLLLIAREDADPDAVYRLVETIYDSPLRSDIHPPPLDEQVPPFPFHPGTERFLHRHDPLLTPETTSRIGSIVGGTASFLSGIVGLVTFLRIRKLRRFESYYRELSRIELTARQKLSDPDCPNDAAARRAYLDSRLSALQCRVYHDFARGRLRGENLLADIVGMINDTRESLGTNAVQTEPTPERPDSAKHVAKS